MTASPWATYVNDPLGYRTSETSGGSTTTYTWDVLQRMTGRTASDNATYEYRADGMRTYKSVGTSVAGYTNTLTRHDGQMPFELETLKPDGTVTATREALGARGVDAEESVTGTWTGTTRTLGSPTIAYPIYDAHGNRVCTLSRYGSGSWSTTSPRFADAWGTMRTGSATGGSPMRYCASLGHLQDDESGLVYMRGRYYEPSTGRFVSEDVERQGPDWYIYCGNNPVDRVDGDGHFWWFFLGMALIGAIAGMAAYATYQVGSGNPITAGGLAGTAFCGAAAGLFAAMTAIPAMAVVSAAACGEMLWMAFVGGVVGTAVSALGGAIEKGLSAKPSGVGKVLSAVMGEQFLVAMLLVEINEG